MSSPNDQASVTADFWEQRYRQQQTGWDRGEASPALERWLAQDAVPRGRVLVPGCGRGHEVLRLAQAGHDVTAVDVAPSALAALEARLEGARLTATLVQANLLSWSPEQPFDAIYEQTCLCALDPRHWPAYTERLAQWLSPGGTLAALFMQTEKTGGPPFHCALDHMRQLFDPLRWQWPQDASSTVPHPSGLYEIAVLLRRNPA